MAPENGQASVETEVSLEWEDFFGPSTELMPSLLSMYDALVASESLAIKRKTEAATSPPSSPRKPISRQGSDPPVRLRYVVLQRSASLGRGAQPSGDYISRLGARPLSLSSTSSSSSSLPNPGSRPSQAYLASIESLEDNNEADFSDEDVEPNALDPNIENDSSPGLNMSGLPGQHSSSRSPYDGKLSHSERVIQEILDTEKIYVRDVEEVIKGYLNVMKSGNKDWGITAEQIDVLFGNLEEIHAFNRSFLEDLEECEGDAIRVARCFVRHNSGFAIYTQYCTNYPRTVDVLTELMCNKAAGTAFRDRQVKLGHTLPLGSYLLKPVQRILKYHLLLENLVKYMDPQCLGYNDVWAALNTMTGIAHHINEMKRKHERAVRVQEVQSLLFGWEGADLTTYGELAAEGTFRMYGAKALRHVFLFDRILFIVKRKDDGSLVYKAHIMCSNLMLVESVPGEPLTFHVIPFDNPRCQYTLQAHSMEQKREWTLQLKRVILENYDADIPLKAKQLVMQLGQERLDDGLAFRRSSTSTRRQHSAPEYLERRKADRRKEISLNSKLKMRRARRRMAGRQKDNTVMSPDTSLTTDCNDSLNTTKDSDEEDDERKKSIISGVFPNDFQSGCDWRRYSRGNYTSLEDDVFDSATEPSEYKTPKLRNDVSIDEADDVRVETLEEIIGQLLMQNMEFRKMLSRRHQRRHKLSSRQEDTTDTENEDNNNQSDTFAYIRSNRIPLRVPPPTPTSPTPGPQTEHAYGLCFNISDSVPAANDSGCLSDAEVLDGSGGSRSVRRRTKSFCSERSGASVLCAYPVKSLQNMSDVWEKRQTLLRNRYNSGNSKVNEAQPYHPSHRVYKKSLSKSSLKSILTSVSSRLKSTMSQSTLDTQTSCSDCEDRETVYSSRSANSQVYNFARQCSKVLKARVKQLVTETSDDSVWNHSWNSLSGSRHYHVRKQGSSEIGARIAASTEPTTIRKLSQSTSRLSVSESGYNFSGVALRPDSVLSVSSNVTSSSDGDKTSGFGGSLEVSMVSPDLLGQLHSDGENPPEALYESTLDVLDHLEDTEVYRDSAIYSDPDDLDPAYVEQLYSESCLASKVPPPVPEKPKNRHSKSSTSVANIVPYLRGDSQDLDGIKSIDERRKELEGWRRGEAVGDESESSSQHSTSTINTVIENGVVVNKMVSCDVYCEPVVEDHLPKGWVRHVIGKLQGDASLFNSAQ